MTSIKLWPHNEDVTSYLLAHPALQYGGVEPVAALLLANNTSAGRSAIALHIKVDGKDHLVKLTLDMFQTIAEVFRSSAVEQYGEHRKP